MKISSSQNSFQNADRARVAIVMSKYNEILGKVLLENTIATLTSHKVKKENIEVFSVPGALEIPFLTKKLSQQTSKYDVIITLGLVIKGDTYHFDLVSNECYRALMEINLQSSMPIIFGVLTVNTIDQAKTRVESSGLNKGEEFAIAALEMVTLNRNT